MRLPLLVVLPLFVLAAALPPAVPAQENAPAAKHERKGPAPVPHEKGAQYEKGQAPREAYAVCHHPNVGTFYLDGDKGTSQSTAEAGGRIVLEQNNLVFEGSDKSGQYWWYRYNMPGGLNWYFAKPKGQGVGVWSRKEAPSARVEYFGPADHYPIR